MTKFDFVFEQVKQNPSATADDIIEAAGKKEVELTKQYVANCLHKLRKQGVAAPSSRRGRRPKSEAAAVKVTASASSVKRIAPEKAVEAQQPLKAKSPRVAEVVQHTVRDERVSLTLVAMASKLVRELGDEKAAALIAAVR